MQNPCLPLDNGVHIERETLARYLKVISIKWRIDGSAANKFPKTESLTLLT